MDKVEIQSVLPSWTSIKILDEIQYADASYHFVVKFNPKTRLLTVLERRGEGSFNPYHISETIFRGTVKNASEFRVLLNQLGISHD